MGKEDYVAGRSRSSDVSSLGRADASGYRSGTDDDRPFADIRRSVHDALRLLVVHRWAFFIPCSLVMCTAFILSLYYPRTYSATTTFERRNDPVMLNLPTSAGEASFRYFRSTMVRDLTSTETMAEVVENLGLTVGLERDANGELTPAAVRRRDAIARSLAARIHIETATPSEYLDVITITYTGPDPAIGRKLVEEVKRTYIERTTTWIRDFLESQREYFAAQAQHALEEVRKAQRAETRLRLENPLLDPANPGAVSLKLSQLDVERRELLMRKREYEAELASLEEQLKALEEDGTVGPLAPAPDGSTPRRLSPAAEQIMEDIRRLEETIVELKATRGMTDLHPEIRERLEQRDRLERQLDAHRAAAEAPASDAPVGAAARAEVLVPPWSADRARLLAQIAAQRTKLKDLRISLETNELNRERLAEAKGQVFRKQEEFAEVSGQVAQARQRHRQLEATLANIEPAITAIEQDRLFSFSAEQPARGSVIPVSPSAKTIVVLAVLSGLAAGVVFVVLAEVFDHVYRSSAQVARSLGLPMLESIDEIITGQDRRRLFVQRAVLMPMVVVCFLAMTGLTGSMAYLSIQQPWTYQKLRKIPEAAMSLFAEDTSKAPSPARADVIP